MTLRPALPLRSALPFILCALAMLLPAWASAFTTHDDDGNVIELPAPAQRIVSLAPGATAMLFAAGAGDRVVGTSAYSDEPEAAKRIERIGDSQSFDLERVLALHPDVVVVWSGGTSPMQIARLQRAGLRIYHHHLARLDAIPDSVRRLGQLTGTDAQARVAADDLQQRIAALRQRYTPGVDATVLIQIWDRPLYTVGRDEIITDVLHACGFRSAFEDLVEVSPAVSVEAVLARDPDIILALTSDQNVAQHWLQQWRAFSSMKAQRSGQVIAWSDARLTGFGPGVVDATETLCQALRTRIAPRS
jgi:iron complex transport system substrate-binding protein